jgi:hypothetical protein
MTGRCLGAAAAAAALLAVACGGGESRSPQGGSPDTTAPRVASVTPDADATGVPRSTQIGVVFTEPVSAATVTADTLRLARGADPVAGAVSLSGATAAFVPATPLAHGEAYTLTATTGIRDLAGNALAADHTSSFTIAEAALAPSYEWQRPDVLLATDTIRAGQPHGGFVLAHCLADFDGDGDTDAVVAPGDGSASPMAVEYYESDGGALAHQAAAIAAPVPGLVHARKCVVLDADRDGRLDAFIAGHGYDQPPFPGEAPVLLVNRPGGFAAAALPAGAAGFNHGAATGDVDEDGDGDVFVARQGNPYLLVNDGAGAFALDTGRVPASLRGNVYTSEVVDVDGDSHLDLLAAGHEQDGLSSAVFWGDGTGRYSDARRTVLPAVEGWGVVIDLDADDLDGDGDRDLVLNRTGDPSGLGFYQGFRLQLLEQTGPRTFTDASDARLPGARSTTAGWFPWVRVQDRDGDQDLDLHVEDAARGLAWLNDGSGVFSP